MLLNPKKGVIIKLPFYSQLLFDRFHGLSEFQTKTHIPTLFGIGFRFIQPKKQQALHNALKKTVVFTASYIAFNALINRYR
ncbi:hypothetical protein DID77_00850 [Candidatus Marinamargulisbacteria bacterium SCGC AG-439-L15]|nr:hypothetical protein DID77_00850 [Candidatus Marinamargulisbacteria bacterium SCGC AG-439-L15]